MPSTRRWALLLAGCPLIFAFLTTAVPLFAASKEKVLHSFFRIGTDGADPFASLIIDAAGNLYGTAPYGGDYGKGVVFELMPAGNKHWTEKVLHSFSQAVNDGYFPEASLIFDAAGNLYGTTFYGGAHGSGCGGNGCGAVFELIHGANGHWTEKVLHSFSDSGQDGYNPIAGLIFDGAGNLYGTTESGGSGCGGWGCGVVFRLTPRANGKWTEKVLYAFVGGTDGANPYAGVVLDLAGNLYGTTESGGAYAVGTVFQLIPSKNGKWTESVLYSFCSASGCTDGNGPIAGLILDAAGYTARPLWAAHTI
jgi:uncharacterized repeat protein (TIGR03803 family)